MLAEVKAHKRLSPAPAGAPMTFDAKGDLLPF